MASDTSMERAYYVVTEDSDKDYDVMSSCDSQTDDVRKKCSSAKSGSASFRLLPAYRSNKRRRRAKDRPTNTAAPAQSDVMTKSLPVSVANSHDVGPEVREKAEVEDTMVTVEAPSREQVCLSFCKRFLAFLLSTFGLSILTIIYTIMGGLLFSTVEQRHERQIKSGVGGLIDWHVTELWQLTSRLNVFHEVTSIV